MNGFWSSGSGGTPSGSPGSSVDSTLEEGGESDSTEKAKEGANKTETGTTYESEVVVTAKKEGKTKNNSGFNGWGYLNRAFKNFVRNNTGATFSVRGGFILAGGITATANSDGTIDIFLGAGLGGGVDIGGDLSASANLVGTGEGGITTLTSVSGGFGLHGAGGFAFGEGGVGASAGIGVGAGAQMSSLVGYRWVGLSPFGE